MELLNRKVTCPYCGEGIELLIDDSASGHMSMDGRCQNNAGAFVEDYYEDCSVCCRPIRIQVSVDVEGECSVLVLRDDE
ncbi:MAG: CPXCG motif-containing cysteine-rich protein [Gammaproteobacteria bacterium]|nr:CPXCG motif-containing cysteine-rich protein [Gammaproteobacteria bacterium]